MTDDEKKAGVYLPSWTLGVLIALFLSATGWTANTLLETRETVRLVVDRVGRLETAHNAASGLPLQIAKVEAKLDAGLSDLAAIREDLRRIRTPAPVEVRR